MILTLDKELFVNDRYSIRYGTNLEAVFIIVDEHFQGNNNIGRVNKIVIVVQQYGQDGTILHSAIQTSVIGIGNRIVGVKSSLPELRGHIMTQDNMHQCTVILYEDFSWT